MKYATTLLLLSVSLVLKGQYLTTTQLLGQLNTINTAVPFLLITPDARAGGLGDAGCASSPDVYSNFWNPAKNAFSKKKNGLSFSWTPWLRALVPGINIFSMSAYKKVGKKITFGLFENYSNLGDITFINITGTMIMGQFRPRESCSGITYSMLLTNNFSAGVSMKYINSNLTGSMTIGGTQTYPGKSVAADISCFWKDTMRVNNYFPVLSWGVTVQNVGSKISYSNGGQKEFLPQNLKLGVSYKRNVGSAHSIEWIMDANKLLVPTPPNTYAGNAPDQSVFRVLYTSFYDAPGGFKEELHEIMIACGIEYWYKNKISARTGYFHEHATKGGRKYFTLGIGRRYKGAKLDISYLIPTEQRHPLQNTMRFTLQCEFGKEEEKIKFPVFIKG